MSDGEQRNVTTDGSETNVSTNGEEQNGSTDGEETIVSTDGERNTSTDGERNASTDGEERNVSTDGEERHVAEEEIQKIKNYVELCMTRYMKKDEVIDILHQEMDIEPVFTKLVWEQLEEENPEFFEAYVLSLMVKDQITRFNDLLERQAAVTKQVNGVVPNGSHKPPRLSSTYRLETCVNSNIRGILGFMSCK